MPPKSALKGTAADWDGLDPAFMTSIMDKISPNPVTGRIEMADIMQYMTENPSEMEMLVSSMDDTPISMSDLARFDYASLGRTVKPHTQWVVQLENMGVVGPDGQPVPEGMQHTVPGARSTFTIICYDTKQIYRAMLECKGLPSSDDLLCAIQTAIASPLPPSKPALPEVFLISSRFAPHLALAQPFLDSLPSPFSWRMETAAEAETVASGILAFNEEGIKKAKTLGAEAKAKGNLAFAKKERQPAVEAYSKAIRLYLDVLDMKPDDQDKKEAEKQLAVCYANRAAALLMDGPGGDASKALEDGKKAEEADPGYAKAYVRQASAHERLGDKPAALRDLRRALSRPELENDNGLVDKFIDLLTDGKGLSNEESEFKSWAVDRMLNQGREGGQLMNAPGEFKRRLDAQFAKWQR